MTSWLLQANGGQSGEAVDSSGPVVGNEGNVLVMMTVCFRIMPCFRDGVENTLSQGVQHYVWQALKREYE